MANIIKDSVHIYVRDLISEGFKPNNNNEKSFSCNRKSTVVGVVIYFVVQASKTRGSAGSATETPLDILNKRYAKGEIDKEEFNRKKKDLEL
jgi:hypothetical protein